VEKFTNSVILITVHACITDPDLESLIYAIESIASQMQAGRIHVSKKGTKGNEGVLGEWQDLLSNR